MRLAALRRHHHAPAPWPAIPVDLSQGESANVGWLVAVTSPAEQIARLHFNAAGRNAPRDGIAEQARQDEEKADRPGASDDQPENGAGGVERPGAARELPRCSNDREAAGRDEQNPLKHRQGHVMKKLVDAVGAAHSGAPPSEGS